MIATSTCNIPAAQNFNTLKEVWQNLSENSCPYSYNFHLHTVCSDGQMTPSGLIQQAVSNGLKGLAITDHHTINGFRVAQSWLENFRSSQPETSPLPHLWVGVEVTSILNGVEVHILGYAFNPEHPAIDIYLQGDSPKGEEAQAAKVIAAIHQANGLVVLAHPARYTRPAQELIPLIASLGIDGVEAYYAYGNPKPWKASMSQTQQVKLLASQYGLFTTCGTDSHGTSLLQRI